MKTISVKHAREAARHWVLNKGSKIPGFQGAFFHGSINGLSDDDTVPSTSDVDVMVVLYLPEPPGKLGKFLYQDVLLEVSYLSIDQIASPEQVLSHYHLAGSFRRPGIISDPSGQLTTLHAAVSRDYAKREWVYKRCDHARTNVLNMVASLNESAPFHDQVTSWLFATGVTTHILLVAGTRNPTVRKRYLATRELLADYQLLDFYETLLEMLGCATMSRECVERHLTALEEVFDVAKTVLKTPYRFAADISDTGRPIVIEGSREMIERGFHREAIFWMVATYSRCQWILAHDAPVEVQSRFNRGYQHLLADLGILSFVDLQNRCEQVKQSLPRIWEVAKTIIAANPEIED